MKKASSIQLRLLRLRYALFCFRKAFRIRKKEEVLRGTSDMFKSNDAFICTDDKGEGVVFHTLFSFDSEEGKHYVVYTDGKRDSEGSIQVYASTYDPQRGDDMELHPVETDEEWALIRSILADIEEKVRNGERVGSNEEDEEKVEEEEVLESLRVSIRRRVGYWTDRLHFPVGYLMPYALGVVVFWLTRAELLPIWVDAIIVFLELLLMRVSYDDIEDTHTVVSWLITANLYMLDLLILLDPLIAKVFPNTARITYERWGYRGFVIVALTGIILWNKWKLQKRRKAAPEKKHES